MLRLGKSKHWSHALNLLTGKSDISGSSIMEYYSPLIKWLEKENLKYQNETIGF